MTFTSQRPGCSPPRARGWLVVGTHLLTAAFWWSTATVHAQGELPRLKVPAPAPLQLDGPATAPPLAVPLPSRPVTLKLPPPEAVPTTQLENKPSPPIIMEAVDTLPEPTAPPAKELSTSTIIMKREPVDPPPKTMLTFEAAELLQEKTLPPSNQAATTALQSGRQPTPISLDAVLRLAQDRNGQVRLARERLNEAFAEQDVAARRWLPGISVGAGLIRRLEAERKVTQQQGELSKLTSEQLLEAATAYVDLLAARSAAAIGQDAERQLRSLLEQSQSLEKVDSGLRVEVARVESELGAQRILTRRLREGTSAAAARLIYLLGLDPAGELAPLEKQIMPLKLVDVSQPSTNLIGEALRRGPGVQELESILGLLEDMRARGQGRLRLMPTLPASERNRVFDSKIQQAYLTHADVRGRLTLGVQEATEAARSAREQMVLAENQIKHAEESYNLSDMRLRQNIKGRSPSEVLLAVRALAGARLSYLNAIRDYNKAQLRLFVLTGGASATASATAEAH